MTRPDKQQALSERFPSAAQLQPSVLHEEIGCRLLQRLEMIKLAPESVLDLGCGQAGLIKPLQQQYPRAEVYALDKVFSQAQLAAKQKIGWRRRVRTMVADAEQQPLADDSINLVFSNLMLHWFDYPAAAIKEIARVLCPAGPVMFSCYGPDTLLELRQYDLNLPEFIDMHDLGDDLLAAGLADPVMEMEKLQLKYATSEQLLLDLQAAGLLLADDSVALIDAQPVEKHADFMLTIEVVYGHAWKPEKQLDSPSFKGIEIKPFKSP